MGNLSCSPDVELPHQEPSSYPSGWQQEDDRNARWMDEERPKFEHMIWYFTTGVLEEGCPVLGGNMWKWLLLSVNEGGQLSAKLDFVNHVVRLKRALLGLAARVNERASAAVEELGRLWLRTPEHFMHANLIDCDEEDTKIIEEVKPASIDESLSNQKLIEHIQQTYVHAWLEHDGHAVEELLALACDTNLPDTVMTHLYSVVLNNTERVVRRDEERKMISKNRLAALTASWPKIGFDHPKAESYLKFMRCLAEGRISRPGFHQLMLHLHDVADAQHQLERQEERRERRTQKLRRGLSRGRDAMTPRTLDALEKDQEADLDRQESGGSSEVAEVDEALTEGAETELYTMDSNYMKMAKRDPLLHLSPQVCAALLKICEKGTDDVRAEERIVNDEKKSQFERVAAAEKIGEFSRVGNSLAEDILLNKLCHHKHWLVRDTAYRDMLALLEEIEDATSYKLRQYVNAAVKKMIEAPQGDADVSIQETLESRLKEVISDSNANKRKVILDSLGTFASPHGQQGLELVNRFLKVQKPLVAEHASLLSKEGRITLPKHRIWMRKEQERIWEKERELR